MRRNILTHSVFQEIRFQGRNPISIGSPATLGLFDETSTTSTVEFPDVLIGPGCAPRVLSRDILPTRTHNGGYRGPGQTIRSHVHARQDSSRRSPPGRAHGSQRLQDSIGGRWRGRTSCGEFRRPARRCWRRQRCHHAACVRLVRGTRRLSIQRLGRKREIHCRKAATDTVNSGTRTCSRTERTSRVVHLFPCAGLQSRRALSLSPQYTGLSPPAVCP